ncbi:hypothetical protein SBBP1_410002 [Burkholderiales bacterium]|nr:hypothetical protein SBBP1_410002 [Burkholderiales bacterium]
MDKKQMDNTRANSRQTKIDAETEIQELSFDQLNHVAGGTRVEYLTIKLQNAFITS